jgi:hypothetical protein
MPARLGFQNNGGMARNLQISAEPACDVTISPADYVPAGGGGAIDASGIKSYPTILTVTYVDQYGEPGALRLECYQPGMFRLGPPSA